ncbi:5-formyltetrahydrofolate cyclo-ligase [Waterburya agarophytonicola K14]|uniref:5-formyltetrahydrofolate cyclo-ligase n=1 Tax=Waterburya agarophytonicola KI4 TaxID=2874699 RepID=A0A964FI30_9CYAN|nr:5-formyltetrahydrofolate cyclo-ligase [Waterburya agarophytonicola]MCC0178109.1 5-formyltetrahydrofolate cyclo-ligase [Waterburya agarophytonicola KI4]
MEKSILRKKILKQRQELSELKWQTKSNLICDRLISSPLFLQSNTIFAYFSFRKEVDLNPLFSLNKQWAFPRCVNKSLVWHLWQPGDSLIKDKYGIPTPLESAPIVEALSADLILIPTVACDREKYRLGYGGGFYDRLLSSSQCCGITTIGVVFDFAYLDRLPRDSWDIKLDFVCTETKFLNP